MALHATFNHHSVEDDELQSAESEYCQPRFLSPRNLMTFSPIKPYHLNGFRSIPPPSNFHDLKILDHSRIVKTALDESLQTNIEWMPEYMEKLEEIGRGSFGTVHKCHDTKCNRFFVSKETDTRSYLHKEVAKNEIDILKDLNHPQIVSYYGAAMEHDLIVIFLEYMSGSSLLQNLKQRGPLAEESAIRCSIQTAQGLAYIHDRDIVHIDIKCDNLLLDFNHENVKICDFGCALRKKSNGRISFFDAFDDRIGVSPHWTAPEVLNYEEFDQSADNWSLGCTIIEMLTSKPPYSQMNNDEIRASAEARTLRYDVDELIPNTSDSMKLFLMCLFQMNRTKRLQNGTEAENKLKEIFAL